ncbi:mechanosensitive ion channel [Aquimarina agarivorans]|uniref:mechanosensitive ion channel n=1 Tax=Aquimarina agarivorans TaxID=980584 RepID=UPI000248EDAA|nr:mechanosensitive ion channel [Aquimarina agarivorans]
MDKITTTFNETFAAIGLGKISNLVAAILILIIGLIVAKVIRNLIRKVLKKSKWDNKLLGNKVGNTNINVFIANLFYYVILIFVLLLVLSKLGLDSVLDPIKNMLNEILAFLPNLIAAGVIAFVGYIIAKVVSNLISMGSTLLSSLASKLKISDTAKFVNILQKIVFAVIIIPFIIQALNALNINAISEPANGILHTVLGLLPKILASFIIIALFVIGGKYLTDFVGDLLKSLGIDNLAEKLQLSSVIGKDQSVAKIVSGLLYFFIVFFGIITGVEILELSQLNDILRTILDLSGQILFGLLILIIGNFIATLFYNILSKSENNTFIASIARGAIIALFLAISLRTMGIANSIVELAFGLVLGAVAVAVALSYGLGGREAAGEHMKEILAKFRKKD